MNHDGRIIVDVLADFTSMDGYEGTIVVDCDKVRVLKRFQCGNPSQDIKSAIDYAHRQSDNVHVSQYLQHFKKRFNL